MAQKRKAVDAELEDGLPARKRPSGITPATQAFRMRFQSHRPFNN